MIVCIAEKPSVARDIAHVLGAVTSHEGYLEGNGYQVTWTFGHLCTLKEPADYTPMWKAWSLSALPMLPPRFGIKLIDEKGIKKQFAIIRKLMLAADLIVNCGDAGQEGELIQRWVMQKAGVRCPVKRLWISSLTEEAIREGFTQLKDQGEYTSLYEAGLSRAIGDWILGMNVTRLYTLKYAKHRQILSVGRVQTPTLAMIVNRQLEIEQFQSTPYWVLTTRYRDTLFTAMVRKEDLAEAETSEGDTAAAKGIPPIASRDEGAQWMDRVRQAPFRIESISKKKGREAPPRLFDLTSLQVACNRKYSMSADETLRTIQSLYEKKVTTYPRVDTTYLSTDLYPKCAGILQRLTAYAVWTHELLQHPLRKSKKVFDNTKVTDHHAIIPTGQSATLSAAEQKVYELIVMRFIGAFYPDCTFSTTTVEGTAAEIWFKTSGREVTDPGWRSLNGTEGKPAEGGEDEETPANSLPAFRKGEQGPHEPMLQEKWTQPPKPYTEATLLRSMETAGRGVDDEVLREALKENGLGRPSTRAAIIETLFKRKYIEKQKKNLIPTHTGRALIALIEEEQLKSAELTGKWEKKLREVEKKAYSAGQFIEELKQMVTEIVYHVLAAKPVPHVVGEDSRSEQPKRALRKAKPDAPSLPTVGEGDLCPLCGKGRVIRGKAAYGCSQWRAGCTFRQPFAKE